MLRKTGIKARGLPVNRFYLNQKLATPTSKLAGANVDTIYGFAWLDLSKGPVVVDLPDGGDRYYSIQFIAAYGTILGTRATVPPVPVQAPM